MGVKAFRESYFTMAQDASRTVMLPSVVSRLYLQFHSGVPYLVSATLWKPA